MKKVSFKRLLLALIATSTIAFAQNPQPTGDCCTPDAACCTPTSDCCEAPATAS